MSNSKNNSFYKNKRFEIPSESRKWKSPYDFDSEELQNLQQQGIAPVYTETLTLSTAQSPQNPYLIGSGGVAVNGTNTSGVSGRAFRFMGFTTATAYNEAANTGIQTNVSTAIIGVWFNKPGTMQEVFWVKHGGVWRGDFLKLYVFWPAQSNNSGRITIYKFDDMPGTAGDAST